ncbi:hypothetical protein [Sinorhizobium medicae]|uniref:hypothetical protein n=1 Tax=Sinorhizobium medicae TaxID=110321 RepID=UPI003B516D19
MVERPILEAAFYLVCHSAFDHIRIALFIDEKPADTTIPCPYVGEEDSLARIGGTDDKAREVVQTYIDLAGSFAIKKNR